MYTDLQSDLSRILIDSRIVNPGRSGLRELVTKFKTPEIEDLKTRCSRLFAYISEYEDIRAKIDMRVDELDVAGILTALEDFITECEWPHDEYWG